RLMQVNPDTLTDIQRAARYLYLQRMCFGGRSRGRTFGTSTTGVPRFNLFTLQRLLEESWMRLSQVVIECLDFRDLIPRYDRDYTLFFLDPPYWKIDGYAHNFVEQDFIDLAEVLAGIKGRFLMTINDTPEIREIFKRFTIEEVELKYSMSKKEGSRSQVRTELLISN
ncbi:MAG: DNA adenine methylase, partial [Geobacteraceae bacterium]|nr:DNA adenine methylase [Geobacteraceae bacterium]